jgi:hypothetical protein
MVNDMPKLECPFVRREIDGNYVVTAKIAEGFEWVFDQKQNSIAVEKLNGTNVSIVIEDGVIKSIWNRTERLPFFNKGKIHVIQGLLESFDRRYCELPDGQHFGELIGEKVNGNPYKIKGHLWLPFNTFCRNNLAYKSWQATNEDGSLKWPRTYEGIFDWFKTLMPLYFWQIHGRLENENAFVEGVVFTHPDGRMAKLRRDMFPWFKGPRHKE